MFSFAQRCAAIPQVAPYGGHKAEQPRGRSAGGDTLKNRIHIGLCLSPALAVFFLGACITTPPQSHLQSIAPNSAIDVPTSEFGFAVGTDPVLSGGHAIPLGESTPFVVDLTGEAGVNHGSFTPGIWLRSGANRRDGIHFGWRVGAAGGLGDLSNLARWRTPWLGPSTHLQLSSAWGERSAWALTLGGEYTIPATTVIEDVVLDDMVIDVGVIPGAWVTLDTRVEMPLGRQSAFFVGGGVGWEWTVVAPYAGAGVRF